MAMANAENGNSDEYLSQRPSMGFNLNNVSGLNKDEESFHGYNLVQTRDTDLNTILTSHNNDDIMFGLSSTPIISKGKTEDTSKFVSEMESLAGVPSTQKRVQGINVHDMAADEMQFKGEDFLMTHANARWGLEDALSSHATNEEVLDSVFAEHNVNENKKANEEQHIAALDLDTLRVGGNNLVQANANRFVETDAAMTPYHTTVAGDDLTMNMSPISEDEMQFNGNDLANLMVDQRMFPDLTPFTSATQPSADNNRILSDVTEDMHFPKQ